MAGGLRSAIRTAQEARRSDVANVTDSRSAKPRRNGDRQWWLVKEGADFQLVKEIELTAGEKSGPTASERAMPTDGKVDATSRRASSWCRRLTMFFTAEALRRVDSLFFDTRDSRLATELGRRDHVARINS